MTIEGILDHVIKNKGKIYLYLDQQLLIYIKSKEEVGKNRIIKAIKISFILLSRKNKLVISMPTSSTANGIGGNIIHIILKVNNWIGKNYQAKNDSQ